MRKLSLALIFCCLLLLPLCNCKKEDTTMEDQKFQQLVKEFLESYYQAHPVWATYIGEHRYDGLLDDYSQDGIENENMSLRYFAEKIESIDFSQLNSINKVDFKILENEIRYQLFSFEELKPYENNPVMYNYLVGGAINSLITRDFAPMEQRLQSLSSRLKLLPALLRNIRINLRNPSEISTQTAIRQNRGIINLIKNDLPKILENHPRMKESMQKHMEAAINELEVNQSYMEKMLLPKSTGDFRLGKELFEKKLRFALQSDLTADEIIRRAEEEMVATQKRMFELAQPLHEKMFPGQELKEEGKELESRVIREVLDEIAKDHPKKDELLEVCRQNLKEQEQFVRDKDLLDLTGINQLEVDWEPEFSRGVAVAGLDSPGPLDKNLKSYFRVSPIPDDWTEEQVESFLREYNSYMLKDLCIHEAMPGHYVQGFYDNQSPSLLSTIFGNGPFVEGWAIYSEKLMTDAGYLDNDPRMELTRLKFYLRAIINAIIDPKIHAGEMTKEEAIKLMTEEGFQELSEAEGKWVRASLTSTQLSTYFVGFQDVLDLEKAYREKTGENFSQKEFNQKLLSYGSLPVRFLKEIILQDL